MIFQSCHSQILLISVSQQLLALFLFHSALLVRQLTFHVHPSCNPAPYKCAIRIALYRNRRALTTAKAIRLYIKWIFH
ncbi:hypothetical protein EDD22DRAFT_895132, partial [Suillus occidentalis]